MGFKFQASEYVVLKERNIFLLQGKVKSGVIFNHDVGHVEGRSNMVIVFLGQIFINQRIFDPEIVTCRVEEIDFPVEYLFEAFIVNTEA